MPFLADKMRNKINLKNRVLIASLSFSLLLAFTLAASHPSINLRAQKKGAAKTERRKRSNRRASGERRRARPPAPTATQPAAAVGGYRFKPSSAVELGRNMIVRLRRAICSARWGVFVLSLLDGRVLYSRDGDKPFTPASNMKVYTPPSRRHARRGLSLAHLCICRL